MSSRSKRRHRFQAAAKSPAPSAEKSACPGAEPCVTARPQEAPALPTHEETAARAREIWEARGRPQGRDLEIWCDAESELFGRAT